MVAGLTVSFVAVSLGAAFGVLSGRGAFAGILSAGIIALVTSSLGGTRIQCSGPTAPMTAITALVVGVAATAGGAEPDRFTNLVILISGALVVGGGLLRLGRFIALVPRVVISGFMSGIAILIWTDQTAKLFSLGRPGLGGSTAANVFLVVLTFVAVMTLPRAAKAIFGPGVFFPSTLITIVALSAVTALSRWDVERVALDSTLTSWSDFQHLVSSQIPTDWSLAVVGHALPWATQLAMLCYLDTLLTSLIMDRLSGESTRQDRELAAQGIANSIVALVGGIPGAQATIRSVLILKEGATLRLAGVLVGVFVLLEMLVFQGLIRHVPIAVLSGILFKVGYDVFDWQPLRIYLRGRTAGRVRAALRRTGDGALRVGHRELGFITVTAAVTVLWNLNAAVIGATIVFHLWSRWTPLPDLHPTVETAGVETED